MTLKFDKNYRMLDGKTPLGGSYFNPVFREVDLRIHALEERIVDWEAAIRTVSDHGIARIDEVLKPALDELNGLLGEVNSLIDQTETDGAAALTQIADYLTAKTTEFEALTQSVTDAVAANSAEVVEYKNSMKALIDAALAELPKPWITISADTAVEPGGRYRLDMTAPRIITLPETPPAGKPIQFTVIAGSFELNQLTLLRNNNKIHKRDKDMTVTDRRRSFQIEHTGDASFGYFVSGSIVK